MRIGVLSDTHGKLDSRIFDLFSGVSRIIHAGDVGAKEVLIDLQAIAPTTAVLGNIDYDVELRELPLFADVSSGRIRIHVTHGHLQPEPATRVRNILASQHGRPPDVLVIGHSHNPYLTLHDGVLVMNPGSASRPRHGFPASVGILTIQKSVVHGRILDLEGHDIPPGMKV